MNSFAKSKGNEAVPEILLEGLLLDVSILDSLLKRHRCSHGRTIHFRRMSMALNRLIRRERDGSGAHRKLVVVADMVSRLDKLQNSISEYNQEQKNKSSSKKRPHNEAEEKWDLQSLKKTIAANIPPSPTQLKIKDFEELTRFWTGHIPEILSRIQHASKSLFIEVGRGFFLPFCTVALGALARIRSLLMEIGIKGLARIRALSEEALQLLPQQDASSLQKLIGETDFEQCTNLFLENDNAENERKRNILLKICSTATQDVTVDREAILRSLGLTEATKGKPSKRAAGRPKHNDSDIEADGNEQKKNNDQNASAIEASSEDDFYTLSSSAPNGANHAEMDDGESVNNDDLPSASHDSLDRNMALVNQFQKQKVAEKQSKKKAKKSKKSGDVRKTEAKDEESERKSKKRKQKKKEASKPKKKKKKEKADFFDSIFD